MRSRKAVDCLRQDFFPARRRILTCRFAFDPKVVSRVELGNLAWLRRARSQLDRDEIWLNL